MLGYTAQQTLDYTQSLYEKKLVTYPRTDSRYLTEDMAGMLPGLIQRIQAETGIAADMNIPVHAQQIINGKKVTDHHAIIPTNSIQRAAISELPSGEKAVFQLIATRLLCSVGDPFRYSETSVEMECAGETFTTKGRTILDPGWKAIQESVYPPKKEKSEDPDTIQAITEVSVLKLSYV